MNPFHKPQIDWRAWLRDAVWISVLISFGVIIYVLTK